MIHQRTLNALEYPAIVRLLASFALTEAGREEALALLPFQTEDEAELALARFEAYCTWQSDPEVRKLCQITSYPDVRPLFAAINSNAFVPDTDSFWALRVMLNQAASVLHALLLPQGESKWTALFLDATGLTLPKTLLAALNRCLSDDALIRDESSPELYRLRSEIRSLHQNCLHKVHDFAVKYNIAAYLQDEYMTISQDRYVLPLKATYKGRLQGILHDWSQTGETCYFEPIFLVELNNRLQELRREEHEEELRVLDYLAGLVRSSFPDVQAVLAFLTLLDMQQAKSRLADLLGARVLHFTPRAEGLTLYGARHPLLALQEASARKEKRPVRTVHPLDIEMRPGDRILLITGGNAGGKTVCLKTLGLIQAMAQSGLPVPANSGSHLFWLTRMDAFIGDEQDLEDHVSTFTAQIEHLAKAWKYLEEDSLVLLDEFGAGTDPTHGAALAQAVLDALSERGAFVLAATHFPTLKIWALSTPSVRAASMLFDPQSKRPLYRLAYDQVGQSQTLIVAKEHGLPQEIITRAEKILLLHDDSSSSHIDRLNALALEREKALATLKSETKKQENEVRILKEKLTKERNALVHELSARIQELMQAWKVGKAEAKETMTKLKKERQALLASLAKQQEATPLEGTLPAVGEQVRHRSLQKSGLVTAVDERKGRVRLDLGGISLWAAPTDIERDRAKATPRMQATSVHTADLGFAMQIDVRGQSAEAAEAEVGRFLDKTVLAGLSTVEIIHGRGTGVLRRALHAYLSRYPGIDHFTLAPEDQGGDGKTLVFFR